MSYRPSILHVLLLCLKRHSQTFRSNNCNKTFSSVYMLLLQLASINFLTLFFGKVYQYPDVFWIVMFLRSLKKVIWRSPHFIFYHHNKTKMLIQKWKVPKWISRILYLQIFCTISYFGCSTFYKWDVFKKIKTLWKHVFSNTIFFVLINSFI